jgi:hypothetical protein
MSAQNRPDFRCRYTLEEQDRLVANFARLMRCDEETARGYLVAEEWDAEDAAISLRGDQRVAAEARV